MPLHPQARQFLDALKEQGAPTLDNMTPQEGRTLFESLTDLFGEPPHVDSVEDKVLANRIPARIYSPQLDKLLPAILYFHGGGWVLGDLNTHDTLCRRLSNASGCAVVSVDYGRPPEHVFPAAVDDCFEALAYVAAHAESLGLDPRKLAVAGDSAGGNLAAATALKARDEGRLTLHSQWLIYPVLAPNFDTPSYLEFATGFGLARSEMIWFWKHYLAGEIENASPLAAPSAADSLAGLPPAHIITAEYDVLRDEGENYAAMLQDAGVPVTLRRYDGFIHGFMHFSNAFDDGLQAVLDLGEMMRNHLRNSN